MTSDQGKPLPRRPKATDRKYLERRFEELHLHVQVINAVLGADGFTLIVEEDGRLVIRDPETGEVWP